MTASLQSGIKRTIGAKEKKHLLDQMDDEFHQTAKKLLEEMILAV